MARFTSSPAISPDGSFIVFSYESDLWQVPASGGTATRLTGMDGEETAASISPDGKWLAFSSDQYGDQDVYVMSLDGGEIKRLTYHQASDEVESWDWDSETIFFRSNRYNRISVYKVHMNGGTPARLFGHYHNTIHNLVKHPEKNLYYFNESGESLNNAERKKYKGPYNPDIKAYDIASDTYTRLTHWEGKDMWPSVDRNGTLYFISDEFNGEYNLYTMSNGSKKRLTSFDRSVIRPRVSADGSLVVFEKEYRIFLYDVSAAQSRSVPVRILKNDVLNKEQNFNTKDNITAFDVSPDKKKMALVSRGELFVSDIGGKFIRQIPTASSGRVLEVKWLSDNKTLLFNQTVNGYQNLFTVKADGSGSENQLTSDAANNRELEMNSDRSKILYLSGRDELRLMDLEAFESETIAQDEFWGFQNQKPRFSPDDNYVLYTARRDFEHDIFVYNTGSKETMNLTKTGISENDPFWSPDGRYIYFTSSRTAPSYPRGGGSSDLYRMALDKYEDPYRSDKFENLFQDPEEKTDDVESAIEISINPEDIMHRLERIGENFGSQSDPFVLKDGDKQYVLYRSNHDEGSNGLYVTTLEDFESPKTKKVDGLNYVSSITEVDGDLYGLSSGSVHSIDASGGKSKKIETAYQFERNLRDEFDQMFDELWANIEENFYIGTFHGIDWKSVREQYREYLPFVNNRSDFRRMMNDMLGELNSSHMGFSSSGDEEDEFFNSYSLSAGIIFRDDAPYQVSFVVKDGPADVSGKDIQPGDVLVAVDGTEVDPEMNREFYFSRPAQSNEISLTFSRSDYRYTLKLHPASYNSVRTNLYDEWVDNNQSTVDEKTGKRVAYVHMKNMGGGELENFLIEMTSEAYDRDALILDLRFNTGGNVHDEVLQFLSQRSYANWKYRGGEPASQPNFTPADKPIVLLQNERSLSDAEVTSEGFRNLGLGTIVGTGTYRWIIFTSGKGLVDGSFYRLPSWGLFTLDGEENLERIGVEPDVEVWNTFHDRIKGQDPQLMKAIEILMANLEDQ